MEHFLIFVAPFLVVIFAVGFLFWWGGCGRLTVKNMESEQK